VRSSLQNALLSGLETILRPIVRLLLLCGIGYSEFAFVAKRIFVQVATDEYTRRGRPANFSQVSAMTAISRKDVSNIRRSALKGSTPNVEATPANTILHGWHCDPDFSDGAGKAKALSFEGSRSFSTLVTRYTSDIPPGAMRSTLEKAGILRDVDGVLTVSQRHFCSRGLDEDRIRGFAFSLGNLASTLLCNAALDQQSEIPNERRLELHRLERSAWSAHLNKDGAARFKSWVNTEAPRFVAEAKRRISEAELPRNEWTKSPPRAIGIGVFYFEED
jgi:Family of unknown function (DUF6502)